MTTTKPVRRPRAKKTTARTRAARAAQSAHEFAPVREPGGKTRCGWARLTNPLYVKYHDEEWGVPSHDDRHLFEMLVLEGAQAGLSWETILNKRAAYRKAFKNFDPKRIARWGSAEVKRLMNDEGIVRNRLKIESAIANAKAFLAVQKEFGSFDAYVWRFVDHRTHEERRETLSDIPACTATSDALSKDLKKRGFRFVGTTIMYAYMQSVGLVNDHIVACFRRTAVRRGR
jgi:DNA-3-methyladenine glycosylase I